MIDKIKFKLLREDLTDWIYINLLDDNNNLIGGEKRISYEEFESMNATQIGKNLYEYTLSPEDIFNETERAKRIEWMMDKNRMMYILLALNGKMHGNANPLILSGIVGEYIQLFHKGYFDFIEDAGVMKDVIQAQFDSAK